MTSSEQTNGDPRPSLVEPIDEDHFDAELEALTKTEEVEAVEYTASIIPGPGGTIHKEFATAVLDLEEALGQPVWVLAWGYKDRSDDIDDRVRRGFFEQRAALKACGAGTGAALLVDSPGGLARSAYQIAKLFRRHCGGFTAVVPRVAKSAATLLVLGADRIYLGEDAEMGPLDVQLYDSDREQYTSALDEVQALERLNSVALEFVDQLMFLLVERTGRKTVDVLPHVLDFSAKFMHPLLDKIDTVHYNERARVLKVAEEYAGRLLRPNYPGAPSGRGRGRDEAEEIAGILVNDYPEHGFTIDKDELQTLLHRTVMDADEEVQEKIDRLEVILTKTKTNAIGRVERRTATT